VHDRLAAHRCRWAVPARGARWLGCDRNPLRRGTDRAEVAFRLLSALLLLTGVPAAGFAAGWWAEHVALIHDRAQAAALSQGQLTGGVFLVVTLTMFTTAFAVLGAGTLARRSLDRHRMRAWDAEWRAVAPLWTRPRA
jgi:hypothetical protein